MDGVTILNSYKAYATYKGKAVLRVISGILTALSFLGSITLFVLSSPCTLGLPLGYGIGCAIIWMACLIGWTYCVGIPTEVLVGMIYEVSVSDDVKFNEFMDRYEILEQRGKIYIVSDKILKDEEDG